MHKLLSFLGRWLPPLGWMFLIFAGSTDVLSAEHTSRVIEPLLRWMLGSHLTPERFEQVHFLIRKGGHVTEYAVLAILIWRALRSWSQETEEKAPPFSRGVSGPGSGGAAPLPRRAPWAAGVAALALAALYAAGDEFHQSFVPSRGAHVTDVLIDTAGAFSGLLLVLAIRRARSRFSGKRRVPPSPPPGSDADAAAAALPGEELSASGRR